MKSKTVITGVIGADAHCVGIKIVSIALERAGFNVISLGAMVSQEEFIDAATESNAGAIFVSSLYGMAALDCEGFKEKCVEAGLKDVLLYIGGILESSKQPWESTEKRFKELGFDRVYPPGTSPRTAIDDLNRDLQRACG
ncbi:MAG: methylaspartate mutase subunit S [Chloroflexi bacterium]|nr:methylaspartate mutase subunit S [Chloroflexota bacterium]